MKKTEYTLIMYRGSRKVGRIVHSDRAALEDQQRQWNQSCETHSSVIDSYLVLENERIDEIAPGQFLTQAAT
jgi:hypothetical protein